MILLLNCVRKSLNIYIGLDQISFPSGDVRTVFSTVFNIAVFIPRCKAPIELNTDWNSITVDERMHLPQLINKITLIIFQKSS
jgi:hypothetical protein